MQYALYNVYIINHNTHMNKTNFILSIIGAILILDAIMFVAWVASGQRPQTDVYAGVITASVVKAIMQKNIADNMIIEHSKIPCSLPDPQFSGATVADYPECR